jgi:hypothetical protein
MRKLLEDSFDEREGKSYTFIARYMYVAKKKARRVRVAGSASWTMMLLATRGSLAAPRSHQHGLGPGQLGRTMPIPLAASLKGGLLRKPAARGGLPAGAAPRGPWDLTLRKPNETPERASRTPL